MNTAVLEYHRFFTGPENSDFISASASESTVCKAFEELCIVIATQVSTCSQPTDHGETLNLWHSLSKCAEFKRKISFLNALGEIR